MPSTLALWRSIEGLTRNHSWLPQYTHCGMEGAVQASLPNLDAIAVFELVLPWFGLTRLGSTSAGLG
jgi:hypothetical protein